MGFFRFSSGPWSVSSSILPVPLPMADQTTSLVKAIYPAKYDYLSWLRRFPQLLGHPVRFCWLQLILAQPCWLQRPPACHSIWFWWLPAWPSILLQWLPTWLPNLPSHLVQWALGWISLPAPVVSPSGFSGLQLGSRSAPGTSGSARRSTSYKPSGSPWSRDSSHAPQSLCSLSSIRYDQDCTSG